MRPLKMLLRLCVLLGVAFLARAEGPPPELRTALIIGSGYQGNVGITRQGKVYHLTWQVGSSSYEGDGKLAGNLLTVDWGASTPVIYALKPEGSLAGLWDAGKGEETLTPEE